MNKTVYITGKTRYMRPYFKDTGENLEEGSDIRNKLESTDGVYSTDIVLPFEKMKEAKDFLTEKGIPLNGMMGQLLKETDDGEIIYKIKRPHMEPNMPVEKGSEELGFVFGPPKVVDAENNKWDEEVLIGNGSDATFKLNVWKGTKVTKVRWDGVRIDELVPYESDGEGF